MSYSIDFTASFHVRRKAWNTACALAVLAALTAAGWGGWTVFEAYMQPTLGQRLLACHDLSGMVVALHDEWKATHELYQEIVPYYRLIWAESVTNALPILEREQAALPAALRPVKWRLATGGDAELTYELGFDDIGKTEQLADALKALTAMLRPWNGTVAHPGGDLGDKARLTLTSRFQLRPVRERLPPPSKDIEKVATDIASLRTRVLSHPINASDPIGRTVASLLADAARSADALLSRDDPSQAHKWQDAALRAVSPRAFLVELERTLQAAGVPVPPTLRQSMDEWDAVAERRWPWRRVRDLDNANLDLLLGTLKDFAAGNPPRTGLFVDQHRRLQSRRDELLKAYSEHEVFNEKKPQGQLEGFAVGKENMVAKSVIGRAPVRDGLMLATWKIELGSAKTAAEDGSIDAQATLGILVAIPALRVGFELDTVTIDWKGTSGRDATVSRATANGLLPVVANQATGKQ